MNLFRKVLCSILLYLFSLVTSTSHIEATFDQRGPDPRTVGLRNLDLSIYRTVNTLSCHPQNPLLTAFPDLLPGEVPLWISFNPDKQFGKPTGSSGPMKGYCIASHFLEYSTPAWVGVAPNPPNGKPDQPWWHYVVIEIPNPCFGMTTANSLCKEDSRKLSGQYLHWEGMVQNDNSSVSTGNHETWHLYKPPNNTFGGLPAWNSITTFTEHSYTALNGTTQPGIRMDPGHSGVSLNTCSRSETTKRTGDQGLPCFSTNIDMNADSNTPLTGNQKQIYWNPTHFTDIPHDKWGHVTTPSDRSWMKCANQLPSDYFTINATSEIGFGRKTPPEVFPVTPQGCDYPPMNGTPGTQPVCLDQSLYPANAYSPNLSTTLPMFLEGCRGTLPSTGPATSTLTPTSISPKPGDANGDTFINVQDYNILVTQFNQSGPRLPADFNKSGRVDVQDYNILTSNFGR
jgi:hypothetical protein